MMSKIYNFMISFLLILVICFSGYFYYTNKKIISSLNYDIENLNNNIANSKTELKALKSFVDSMNRGFDVNIVEAIISNTRSGFEGGFQSIKSYLIDLNKEVKTIKENQAIILTKIDKYEEMTKGLDSKSNIKALIDESKSSGGVWSNRINSIELKLRDLESKLYNLKTLTN